MLKNLGGRVSRNAIFPGPGSCPTDLRTVTQPFYDGGVSRKTIIVKLYIESQSKNDNARWSFTHLYNTSKRRVYDTQP